MPGSVVPPRGSTGRKEWPSFCSRGGEGVFPSQGSGVQGEIPTFGEFFCPGIGRQRHSLACSKLVRRAWWICVQVADSLAVGCAPDADMAREVCDKNALAIVSEYSPEWQITGAIQRAVLATISIPDDNCIIPAARYQAAIMPVTD